MGNTARSPAAPRLRALRDAWLGKALDWLQRNHGVAGAALVGSLGRGDFDDWSDVDLLIAVPDEAADEYADMTRLPGAECLCLSFDARQNSPRGTGAVSGQYIIEGLPLWADLYVYPVSRAGWATDAHVIFDRRGLPSLERTFAAHLAAREPQPAVPKPANDHRLLQIALIPVAGKHIARRSPGTARMIEFLGGPYLPGAEPREHLDAVRQLLARHRDDGPAESLLAASAYLGIIESTL
jgi:hypothetical protein